MFRNLRWSTSSPPQTVKDLLIKERERLFGVLLECSFLTPYPSSANFILCRSVQVYTLILFMRTSFPSHRRVEGRDAFELKEILAAEGIMVRHYMSPASISGCIRVSVGKPEHTDALRQVLSKI